MGWVGAKRKHHALCVDSSQFDGPGPRRGDFDRDLPAAGDLGNLTCIRGIGKAEVVYWRGNIVRYQEFRKRYGFTA